MYVLIGKNTYVQENTEQKLDSEYEVKLLILESSASITSLIADQMEQSEIQYSCKSVDNYDDFVTSFENFQPSIIIADSELPNFKIIEALNYLNKYKLNSHFIIVGEKDQEEEMARYLQKGAHDFITKSNITMLLNSIEMSVAKNRVDNSAEQSSSIHPRVQEVYENLLHVQSQLGVGFVILDSITLQPLYVNQTFCSFCGYEPNELLELPSFLSLLDEESVSYFQKELPGKDKDKSSISTIVLPLIGKDGFKKHLKVTIKSVSGEQNAQIILIVRDISDKTNKGLFQKLTEESLKESEKRFRALIEDVKDYSIFMIDSDAKIIGWNAGAERMLGYSEGEVKLKRFHKIISVDENLAAEILKLFKASKESGRIEKELWVAKKGGQKLWAAITITSLNNLAKDKASYSVIIRDLTKSKSAENELLENEKQLRSLASHLQAVREEERTRIARELHDEFSQMLTALRMDLTILGRMITKSVQEPLNKMSLLEKISSISELLETTIRSTRKIITELRPAVLDELGLLTAIQWQAQEFENRTGIRCKILRLQNDIELNQNSSTAIFRIFQEALTNVARHSEARNVSIELFANNGILTLEITDDGIGMDEGKQKDPTSTGILGIRERVLALGGKFEINSQSGNGTKLIVIIPYIKEDF